LIPIQILKLRGESGRGHGVVEAGPDL
jgi:hypothetical protein